MTVIPWLGFRILRFLFAFADLVVGKDCAREDASKTPNAVLGERVANMK